MTTRGDVDEAGPPVDRGTTMTEKGRADLLDAVLSVANGLDLTGVLERFVTASVELTGASFGALNVLDARGTSTTFVQVGVSPAVAAMLRHAPHNIGVLGQIPDEGVLALDNVDASVRQIRQIVYALRDPDAANGIVERLRREASLARTGLGFAPSFVVTLDGETVPDGDYIEADQIDARIGPDLTDDVVAVVREGLANAARHAQASSVAVRVIVKGQGPTGPVIVAVADDGPRRPLTLDDDP